MCPLLIYSSIVDRRVACGISGQLSPSRVSERVSEGEEVAPVLQQSRSMLCVASGLSALLTCWLKAPTWWLSLEEPELSGPNRNRACLWADE